MSNRQEAEDWWVADDGRWYPPERHPDHAEPPDPSASDTERSAATPSTKVHEAPVPVLVPETNGMAIAALVMSILGYVFVGFGTFFGIAFGLVALRQLRRASTQERGRGLAVAALILSLLQVLIAALLVTLFATFIAVRLVGTEIDLQRGCSAERQSMKAAAEKYRDDNDAFPTSKSEVDSYLDSPVYNFDYRDDGSGKLSLVGPDCRNRGVINGDALLVVGVAAFGLIVSLYVWRRKRGRVPSPR